MGRKLGFSFSWKRATGLSAAKGRLSRKLGVPLTRSGRQRKIGRATGCSVLLAALAGIGALAVLIASCGGGSSPVSPQPVTVPPTTLPAPNGSIALAVSPPAGSTFRTTAGDFVVPPPRFEVEVTYSVLVQDSAIAIQFLAANGRACAEAGRNLGLFPGNVPTQVPLHIRGVFSVNPRVCPLPATTTQLRLLFGAGGEMLLTKTIQRQYRFSR